VLFLLTAKALCRLGLLRHALVVLAPHLLVFAVDFFLVTYSLLLEGPLKLFRGFFLLPYLLLLEGPLKLCRGFFLLPGHLGHSDFGLLFASSKGV
jgi:hypothetical protein